ncbi:MULTISPECIES: LemA family protein [Olleya]|jgi:LemA protein|uniref:LemA family protein n=1 Tax=Olleya marilimosa TaxID=272164 RepID=A0ABR8LW35_9FLAO|nr:MULTISPECIES: LemA family protein [Olleya]MBD3864380.1 LemA family protein [Olleya marilimosa]TVZ47405.1 LemA protein [Olleya sp. Hel_I_94]|tara:strand:- start:1301 stop:1900 length:600 start_codon:yes stop_codon:yes gene_type:complete
MKKWLVPVIIIAIIAFSLYKWAVGINNTAVTLEANAKTAWSNVESTYQRRNDLYSSVIKTVQGSADFERKTLNEVIAARAKATSVNIDASNLTPEKMEAFQKAQSELSGSFSRLIASFERYPELKTTEQFKEFISQQEGTENRINVARDRYNEEVNKYDIYTSKFPNSLLTGWFGFKEMARYKADPGSENVPDVEFKFD